MTGLVRFSVSLEEDLLKKFDHHLRQKKYTNRSEALRDLIRDDLVKEEWEGTAEVMGIITLVYHHHQRELVARLMEIQHHHPSQILSTQHIHIDQGHCLEIIVVKGKPKEAEHLHSSLKSVKGVKHAGFTMTSTGKELV